VANHPYQVLFLCNGNSARSIMAECAINRWGNGKFKGFSAGSHPQHEVHPLTIELLKDLHYDTSGLRSKSWDEFARPDSPRIDFVITVCDQTAAESCPIWPGHPTSGHWGVPDPVAFKGSEEQRRESFRRVYDELENRIKIFVRLPIETLDPSELRLRLREIGEIRLRGSDSR